MTSEERIRLYSKVVAKAWADPAFKSNLISNPNQVLSSQFGVEIPPNMIVQVVENSSTSFNIGFQEDASQISGIPSGLTPGEICEFGCFGTVGSLGTAGTACGTLGTAACLGTAGSYDI